MSQPEAAMLRHGVPMVDRALDALEVFAGCGGEVSLRELAARIHATRSSAYRIVVTLQARGFVERSATGGYRLGHKLGALADVARTHSGLGGPRGTPAAAPAGDVRRNGEPRHRAR